MSGVGRTPALVVRVAARRVTVPVMRSVGRLRPAHNAGVEPAFVLHLPPAIARLAFGSPYDPYGDGYVHRFDVELIDDGLPATAVWLGPRPPRPLSHASP